MHNFFVITKRYLLIIPVFFNSGCSQSNTNDEDEVVKKRTSVFVLYVDTLAEEYEEMDRSV